MSKVQIVPDELGNVVRQSTNNPEFGYVRLEQERVSFGSNGWVKRSNLSTLLHGKMEDFNAMDLSSQTELKGKIIVREQTEPFSANDPDRDLKYAGNTGIVCCSFGEPIYRKTFFVTDVNAEDVLIAHTNGDAIREANASDSPSSKATEAVNSLISEEVKEEVEEETEEAEEMEEELDDSFEL